MEYEREHSHHHHHHHHRKKKWPWIVGGIVVLVVILAAIAGIFGMKLYSQAKQVQQEETQAITILQKASDLSNISQDLKDSIPQAQEHAHRAEEIAHSQLWNIAANIPFFGTNIATVQGMTSVVSDVVDESVPQCIDVMNQLNSANLASSDGINVKPIMDAAPAISKANESLQKQVDEYNALPQPTIGMISTAYKQGYDKLNALAGKVDGMANAFTMLPVFLGGEGEQHYAVMAMTTSEMRSSGGLIGSVGELSTDNGTITVGDFRPNGDYLPYGIGNRTADEQRIFTTEGPVHMSFDIRDLAVYPDTQSTAESMKVIWDRTPWGKDNPLSGVITVDPVFVQELIRINGDMTLEDGTVLTGDNTAEFLLNTVYEKYDESKTDEVFGSVAQQCLRDMFMNISVSKLAQMADMLDQMAKERHFSMYSFNGDMEEKILTAGFTATSPVDETKPAVGIYLTEQNPSKMGWYIKRSAKIKCIECKDDGSCVYHVEYTLKNTITQEQADNLSWYITSVDKKNRGKGMEKILFYPPAGGEISNIVELNGPANAIQKDEINGTQIYRTMLTLLPGQEVTYSFDVTTSNKAKTALTIDQTPMGWTNYDIQSEGYSENAKK